MRWFMWAVAVPLLAMNGGAVADEIRPVHTDKCLDVTNASQAAGARIIQFVCRQGGNQRWFVDKAKDGTAQIKSLHSGMCMDVDAGALGNNASIIQFPCKKAGTKAARNQTFRIKVVAGSPKDDQRVTIVNVLSNRCLDIDGASPFDGAGLIQFQCLGQPNQQFRIR